MGHLRPGLSPPRGRHVYVPLREQKNRGDRHSNKDGTTSMVREFYTRVPGTVGVSESRKHVCRVEGVGVLGVEHEKERTKQTVN